MHIIDLLNSPPKTFGPKDENHMTISKYGAVSAYFYIFFTKLPFQLPTQLTQTRRLGKIHLSTPGAGGREGKRKMLDPSLMPKLIKVHARMPRPMHMGNGYRTSTNYYLI